MEIEIEEDMAFDYIIEALKGLTKENYVRVNSDFNHIGTLIDFETGLHRIYPNLSVEVNINYSNGNYRRFYLGKDQSKYVEINIEEYYKTKKEDKNLYTKCELISEKEEVVALSAEYQRNYTNLFEKEISRYLKLPEKGKNVGVKLWYHDPFYFYISLPYQNSEKLFNFYAIFKEKRKTLNSDVINIVKNPIIWNSKGRWMSIALNVIAGNYTVKTAGEKYHISEYKIKRKINEVKDPLFNILRNKIVVKSKHPYENTECPEEYFGLLMGPVYRSMIYLLINGMTDKIVDEYNKWAKENGYEKIQEEEIKKIFE